MYMRILYMRILGGQQVEPQRSGELWGRSGELWACFEDALESSGDALWTSGDALGSSGEALGKLWETSGEALGSFGDALGTISGTPGTRKQKGSSREGTQNQSLYIKKFVLPNSRSPASGGNTGNDSLI